MVACLSRILFKRKQTFKEWTAIGAMVTGLAIVGYAAEGEGCTKIEGIFILLIA